MRAKYNTKAISINLEDSYNRNHKYGVEVSYNAETLMAAEELSHEQLRAYFARLKDKNPKLAKEIEISIKDQSYLPPHRVINKAGFDYEIIEAWADLVAEEDKYAPFERCDECEGEGYVLTSYTSATRFDPADGDGEDCGECGGTGEIDPADYMYSNHDGQVGYLAETFSAEPNFIRFLAFKKDAWGFIRPTWYLTKKDAIQAGENPNDIYEHDLDKEQWEWFIIKNKLREKYANLRLNPDPNDKDVYEINRKNLQNYFIEQEINWENADDIRQTIVDLELNKSYPSADLILNNEGSMKAFMDSLNDKPEVKEADRYSQPKNAETFEEKSITPYLLGVGIVGILGYAFTRKL